MKQKIKAGNDYVVVVTDPRRRDVDLCLPDGGWEILNSTQARALALALWGAATELEAPRD